ncbi:Hypothetical_protein [Hexamita inflata]|uniref:Hypothetical_protein n=1 Tax=Hexamita inflata TaxID=28002 RepID=A0AA86UDL8_9EUKA|nr:Hypothetical protein HINF_LOCUS35491 [Hexamita inflata]
MLNVIILSIATTQSDCNNIIVRTLISKYCEKSIYVVDKIMIYTQTYATAFSFFLHTEVAKNVKITAEITTPSFSTFYMIGNLVVEHCIIQINTTSKQSALLSIDSRDIFIIFSVFKTNYKYIDNNSALNAAGLTMNSFSIIVIRVNLTVDINTKTGDISGVTGFCPNITLEQLRGFFTMYTISATSSNSGAISAVAQNVVIAISNSTLSGNMYAAADNGYLVGAGINVTIDVSEDSLITITGPQTNNTAHFWSCYGFCERPLPITTVLPVSAVTQIGSSSSCVFTQGTTEDNSEVVFDPSRDFSFQGNFSVFGQAASVSNLKVSGRYQVTGELGSYANIFGSNMTDVLVLRKIIIQVSISALSQCKLNLVTNSISAQFTINSFLANGSFQTEFQTFNAIAVAAQTNYQTNQARSIINYQIIGQVSSNNALSTLGIQVTKFIDLNIMNSFFTTRSNFITNNGLIVGNMNQDQNADCEGIFNFFKIEVKQKLQNSDNMVVPSGILFQLIVGTSLNITNVSTQYACMNNVDQMFTQSIFGNMVVTTGYILGCNISHIVNFQQVQRLGLISLNSAATTSQVTVSVVRVKYEMKGTFNKESRDIGMVGFANYQTTYSFSSIQVNGCQISMKVSCEDSRFVGAVVGQALVKVYVQNSSISDSCIESVKGQNIGSLAGIVGGLRLNNVNVSSCNVTALSDVGLVQKCIGGISYINNLQITGQFFAVQDLVRSSLVFGQISGAQTTISVLEIKQSLFTSHSSFPIVFGLFNVAKDVNNLLSNVVLRGFQSSFVVGNFVQGNIRIQSSQIEAKCFTNVLECAQEWKLVANSDITYTV